MSTGSTNEGATKEARSDGALGDSATYDVAIIGGGVVGAASAYYLSRTGVSVVIIDQSVFGGACSHGNCGYVCPSHILPLNEPGMVGQTLRSMLRKDSPFYVKPRLDPALWLWLLRFATRCNEKHMLTAGRALQGLLVSSRALYRELIESESLECEWATEGLLYVYKDEPAWERYAETDRFLREHFEMPAERWDGATLVKREPALRDGLAGAWWYRSDAHLRPDRLMGELRRVLTARGVRILENCAFEGWASEDAGALSGKTSRGPVRAKKWVVATGAWTPRWSAQLGCSIPIQPGKGYSITMPRPEPCPKIPVIFPQHRVAVTPMTSGYRLGSTMEFSGYDTSLSPRRLELLRRGAEPYLRTPYCEPVEETWYGWRPMTPDSLPFIGPAPRRPSVWVAAGHNMLGLSMATATGKLVAEALTGAKPHLDLAPFRIDRFG